MSHENRGRNNSRYFRFENKIEAMRFVKVYRDLFVPYSDYICECEVNEHIKWMLKRGFRITDNNVKVNICPEDLRTILDSGSFVKEKIRKNVYEYIFKG